MKGVRGFLDAPATRHDNGFTLSFTDGHAEYWKLKEPSSIRWSYLPIAPNADWARLRTASTSLQE
jgi:prepilin-type processing-associated H-X9-DG protein